MMQMDKIKILVVEDEPKVAAFIKEGLEEEQYEVTTVFDGYFGLKTLIPEIHKDLLW